MSTAILPPKPTGVTNQVRQPVVIPDHACHIVLPMVSWDAYVTIGELFRDQPILMTYDHGDLEIMTVSLRHEGGKSLLSLLLTLLLMELEWDMLSGGSTTFRLRGAEGGMEPDACFWIQHEAAMRGKVEFDPESDPPPDLILEIEVSRTVLNRLAILARLKAPEVWRCRGHTIEVLLLNAEGSYDVSAQSRALPFLPVQQLVPFLQMHSQQGETRTLKAFVEWVRQERAAWGV
jgi:Uma2 family endonuclease